MIYTTRNPREAMDFIQNLPFEESEKQAIIDHLPTMTELMNQMKNNKSFNSKGGERWFVERIQSKMMASMANRVQPTSLIEGRDHFLAAQAACCDASLEIAEECGCSPDLKNRLDDYCFLMKNLLDKYSALPEDDESDSNH